MLKIINKNCHLTLKTLFYCNILCIILSVHYSVAMLLFIIYIHYKEHAMDSLQAPVYGRCGTVQSAPVSLQCRKRQLNLSAT